MTELPPFTLSARRPQEGRRDAHQAHHGNFCAVVNAARDLPGWSRKVFDCRDESAIRTRVMEVTR